MAEVKLPRYLGECPRCGEPLEVDRQRSTVMPGEAVIAFTMKPCEGWCSVLDEPTGEDT
jgi:hypothetical protein